MNANIQTGYPARKPALVAAPAPFEIRTLNGGEGSGGEEPGLHLHEMPGAGQAFKILWLIRGRARCRIDMQQFEIGDNHLVCIRPGKVSRLDATGCLEGYMISFADNFFSIDEQEFDMNYQRGLSRIFSRSNMIPVREDIDADMKGIAEKMRKEFDNLFLYKDQILRRYLKIFLIYLSRHGEESNGNMGNSRGSELAHEFMSLLEKNFARIRSVESYARHLAITPNHLNVVVKENTGQTAGYHVKQRLILEAKRLAVYSNLCMKEIADVLGFSDTAHFSKFFKNCAGMNFSEFKKEHIRFPLHRD